MKAIVDWRCNEAEDLYQVVSCFLFLVSCFLFLVCLCITRHTPLTHTRATHTHTRALMYARAIRQVKVQWEPNRLLNGRVKHWAASWEPFPGALSKEVCTDFEAWRELQATAATIEELEVTDTRTLRSRKRNMGDEVFAGVVTGRLALPGRLASYNAPPVPSRPVKKRSSIWECSYAEAESEDEENQVSVCLLLLASCYLLPVSCSLFLVSCVLLLHMHITCTCTCTHTHRNLQCALQQHPHRPCD